VIGYPSGQDGAILPAQDTGYVPQGTFIMSWCFVPFCNIDQACSVKMKKNNINTQKKNLANIQPS